MSCGEGAAISSAHAAVDCGQPRAPRVARKRLRQYQRRAIASIGLRTNCAMSRISTMMITFLQREVGRR